MCDLSNDNHETVLIREVADQMDDIGQTTSGIRRSERTNSAAFENWLSMYRYRLAKVLGGRTAEIAPDKWVGTSLRNRH